MVVRADSPLLPVWRRLLSRRLGGNPWHHQLHDRGCDVPALRLVGRYGGLFSDAVPHEVPLHQQAVALRLSHRARHLQYRDDVQSVDACAGSGLLHRWNGEDTGHVRMYE